MPRITKSTINPFLEAAPPKEVFIWDSEVSGFGVRIKPSGAVSFVLKYRIGRGTKRFTIGKMGSPFTPDTARKRAIDLLLALKEGHDPAEQKRCALEALTVSQLIDVYLTEGPAAKPNKKARTWADNRSVLTRHVKPLLGARMAASVSANDIAGLQRDVAAGKTAVTERTKARGVARVRGGKRVAAVCVVTVAAMFEFAVRTGRIPTNPARKVERFKSATKERFLSEVELVLLADSLTDLEDEGQIGRRLADALRLLMVTGCRKNEIATLHREWVDFRLQCIKLPDSKTGARTITLAASALAILQRQQPKPGNPFMFPGYRGDGGHITGLQRAWELARKRATENAQKAAAEQGLSPEHAPNLLNVRIHDLRHTFASFAIADGASLFMVGKLLGHRRHASTQVYAHLADDPVRKATERTAGKIAAAIERPKDGGDNVLQIKSAR